MSRCRSVFIKTIIATLIVLASTCTAFAANTPVFSATMAENGDLTISIENDSEFSAKYHILAAVYEGVRFVSVKSGTTDDVSPGETGSLTLSMGEYSDNYRVFVLDTTYNPVTKNINKKPLDNYVVVGSTYLSEALAAFIGAFSDDDNPNFNYLEFDTDSEGNYIPGYEEMTNDEDSDEVWAFTVDNDYNKDSSGNRFGQMSTLVKAAKHNGKLIEIENVSSTIEKFDLAEQTIEAGTTSLLLSDGSELKLDENTEFFFISEHWIEEIVVGASSLPYAFTEDVNGFGIVNC